MDSIFGLKIANLRKGIKGKIIILDFLQGPADVALTNDIDDITTFTDEVVASYQTKKY